jgi:hypothetical protein
MDGRRLMAPYDASRSVGSDYQIEVVQLRYDDYERQTKAIAGGMPRRAILVDLDSNMVIRRATGRREVDRVIDEIDERLEN